MKLSCLQLPLLGCIAILFATSWTSPAIAQTSDSIALPNQPVEMVVLRYDPGENTFLATISFAVPEQQTQEYTVQVPYTEEVNGETRTMMRTETRTRTVTVMRMVMEERAFAIDGVSFASVSGKKVDDMNAIKKFLSEPKPALLTYYEDELAPYYKEVFKPNTIVMQVVQQMNAPAPAPEPAFAPATAPMPAPEPASGG